MPPDKKTQAAGETADKDKAPAKSEILEPDPDQAKSQDTSTGDETSDAQGQGDSPPKYWVPQERFSKVSRERTKALEKVEQLRQENLRLKLETALNRIGFQMIKPEYMKLFLEGVEIDEVVNSDGEVDEGVLRAAAARFQADRPELIQAAQTAGSGSGAAERERDKRDPWQARNPQNSTWLQKAYGVKQ